MRVSSAPDQKLGLFLIADGGDLNDGLFFNDRLVFRDAEGNVANVDDPQPRLFLENDDGKQTPFEGRVLHASDFQDGDAGNALNPMNAVRTLFGADEQGRLVVAFENKPFDPDNDFNDVVLRVDGPAFSTGGGDVFGV